MTDHFESGTASSVDDLIRTKLRTFATGKGFTDDEGTSAAGRQYLSRAAINLYWASRFDTSAPSPPTDHNLGIYQALGYVSSGTAPGNHTSDSGNGIVTGTNTTLATGRFVPLENQTMNYWFFADGSTSNYIHVVVETSPGNGIFRHFGFGQLSKVGTWTGGAYAYGYKAGGGTSSHTSLTSTYLLDGLARGSASTMNVFCSTLHIESLPSQTASGKWGIVWGDVTNAPGNDRGGTAREFIQGGFRSGPVMYPFGKWSNSAIQGLVPMAPIWTFYKKSTDVYPLGMMRDVRSININSYAGGDAVLVGSDTWVVFPTQFKASTGVTDTTVNQGIAYKRVVT